jgi:hypothetical protein
VVMRIADSLQNQADAAPILYFIVLIAFDSHARVARVPGNWPSDPLDLEFFVTPTLFWVKCQGLKP